LECGGILANDRSAGFVRYFQASRRKGLLDRGDPQQRDCCHRSCCGATGSCFDDRNSTRRQTAFHGRACWLRRHFRIGDNMARPTGVACKPALIRSTAGEGSGGINSSRHTKPLSPRSTSHSSAFLTRSCQQAFSNAVVLKYCSDQSGRSLFGTVRDRLASCLKSPGCAWRISSRRDI
jgi:hypothetical protein